jgi:hypothetical protein
MKLSIGGVALGAALAAVLASQASAADMQFKVKPPPEEPFFFVNVNSLGYSYQFTATNPGAGYTPKNVVTFAHFDAWKYGTNLFVIDWLKATSHTTPSNPCPINQPFGGPQDPNACAPYTEIYGLIRNTFGWKEIFGIPFGPILTNISFVTGFDGNTDNTFLGSAKRSMQAGLQFSFALPYKGSLNIAGLAYKEWQHDGFTAFANGGNPSGDVNFNTTWAVEASYSMPLGFLPDWLPVTFKGLVVVHGPKGVGEPPATNLLPRVTEYLTQEFLSLDVGKMATGKAGIVDVFVGYRWWKNKFGLDPNFTGPGVPSFTLESTWIAGSTWAF